MARADGDQPLLRFLRAARSAGISVSTADTLDALRAIDLMGYTSREAVRDALSLVIAKSAEEATRLRACFDRYFSRTAFAGLEQPSARCAVDREADRVPLAVESPLGRLLLAGDRAGLSALVEEQAAALAVFDIVYVSQRALWARRIMDGLGLSEFDQEIAQLRQRCDGETQADIERMMMARRLLTDEVRAFVDQQFALLARGAREQEQDELLQRVRLNSLDHDQRERMKAAVRIIVKRLNSRHGSARRRTLRGELDARATVRRNMRHGGIPFVRVWKQRRIDKPRVVVLCDVSGSVAPVAEFLLLFVHGLHEALLDVRSFAFSSHLVEVTDVAAGADPERAVAGVLSRIGFGSSNYGRTLADFEACALAAVDKSTTVIVLGDARGNGTEPGVDILRRLFERSRRVVWLNPEPRSAWGTGDSDIHLYANYCTTLAVCNTVRHLEDVVTGILDR